MYAPKFEFFHQFCYERYLEVLSFKFCKNITAAPEKMYQASQHQKRKKKRSFRSLRAVEVNRGRSGYGFTISGQEPCILSCIVSGSPAERAGLQAGDFLIAANGM